MTEPAAGERARELADKATESILQLLREYQAYKPGPLGPYRPALSGEIYARVAGALAAVRLEEREACIQDIQDAVGDWGGPEREHYTQAMQRATEAIRKREQGLDLWGRPLAGAKEPG